MNALRCSNGWLPLEALDGFGVYAPRNGPLTYLMTMAAGDSHMLRAHATMSLARKYRKYVGDGATTVLNTQGHAVAAAWVMATRPEREFYFDRIFHSLPEEWDGFV